MVLVLGLGDFKLKNLNLLCWKSSLVKILYGFADREKWAAEVWPIWEWRRRPRTRKLKCLLETVALQNSHFLLVLFTSYHNKPFSGYFLLIMNNLPKVTLGFFFQKKLKILVNVCFRWECLNLVRLFKSLNFFQVSRFSASSQRELA